MFIQEPGQNLQNNNFNQLFPMFAKQKVAKQNACGNKYLKRRKFGGFAGFDKNAPN